MARILAISSQVASGHVGLSAMVPALQRLGHEVIAIPTVVLSNHPGHPHCAGFRTAPEKLLAILEALAANGRLTGIDTIISGYLPTADHAGFVKAAVERIRTNAPRARYICDPVLGDDPKGLYIEEAAANAIRTDLIPLADLIVPNRFELAWLSGRDVTSPGEAIAAARSVTQAGALVTSVPEPALDGQPATLMNLLISNDRITACRTGVIEKVPHGTGDLFTALFAAASNLGLATARLSEVINQSAGQPELSLVASSAGWDRTQPCHEVTFDETGEPIETWVAGADGCPGGWVVVLHPLGHPDRAEIHICKNFADLLKLEPAPQFIAIDMPIGLPESAIRGGRPADVAVRAVLGDRKSSVFAVPARAAVACGQYREACAVALEHSEPPRKISKQSFMLFPKIREVDELMSPALQRRVFEVHPEAAFWALNGEKPLPLPKKVKSRPFPDGMKLRKKLLRAAGYDTAAVDATDIPHRIAGQDDILDAYAAAWSAARIAKGQARRFPAAPETDAKGLRMEIWC